MPKKKMKRSAKKTVRPRKMPPPAHVSVDDDPHAFDPARDIASPRLSRNTSDDPKGDKLLAKIARIEPAAEPSEAEREFYHLVLRVEERFQDVLDDEAKGKLGADGEDGEKAKYEPTQISTGWWVVLDGVPAAIRLGSGKPDIEAGDTLVLVARTIKKVA